MHIVFVLFVRLCFDSGPDRVVSFFHHTDWPWLGFPV